MTSPELTELEQHIQLLRERVLGVASEIKALLAEDLPLFVEREVKKAFISNPKFAATIDDQTLKQLKSDVENTATTAATSILTVLEDDNLWLPHEINETDDKSMAANATLWGIVNGISESAAALMKQYDFPQSVQNVTYKPPTWFIGRRYLPSLSEKYWRHLNDFVAASAQVTSIQEANTEQELAKRWDNS